MASADREADAQPDGATEDRVDHEDAGPRTGPDDAGSTPTARESTPSATAGDAGSAPDAAEEPMDASTESDTRSDASAPDPSVESFNNIDTVVADVNYVLGVDGLPYPNLRPMVLFKDGTASIDTTLLIQEQDLTRHRAEHPNVWTEWKVVDGAIVVLKGGRWTQLEFQTKFPPHDRTFSIEDTFRRVSGAGNTASGGNASLFVDQNLRLTSDQRIAVGTFSAVTVSSAVFANAPTDKRGRYELDGYRVTIRWDDGRTTETSLVYTLEDPTVIFVSGLGFFRVAP